VELGDLAYTLVHQVTDNDFTFPQSEYLTKIQTAYVTIAAEFEPDQKTITYIDETRTAIEEALNLGKDDDSFTPKYTDQFLIGGTATDNAIKALDEAVKKANQAIAGKDIEMDIELDDYERDDEGAYIIDNNGDLIPLKETISYHVYDPDEIAQAKAELVTAIEAAKKAGVKEWYVTYLPISSSGKTEDQEYKSVTITATGWYDIKLTGANGGHTWSTRTFLAVGGKGGFVHVKKYFQEGDVIKIRLGTEGEGLAKLDEKNELKEDTSKGIKTLKKGGWPNGGSGGIGNGDSTSGSGGGGASEIYYAGNRDNDDYNESYFSDPNPSPRDNTRLLLVAGGGGGAAAVAYDRFTVPGGEAGPNPFPAVRLGSAIAINNTTVTQAVAPTYTLSDALLAPYEDITVDEYPLMRIYLPRDTKGKPSAWLIQYAPKNKVSFDTGITGKGVNGAGGTGDSGIGFEGNGGGGGGYYGGNAVTVRDSVSQTGPGGGGSNYINNGENFTVIENKTADGYGNGRVEIKWSETQSSTGS
jgi:hypothetical protein